ncbi:MAG: DUF883 family protein [Gallionella sp.]|nr:DUF883 family protein [Gallionella sp.]
MADMHALMSNAEDLLQTTANQTGEAAHSARSRVQRSLQDVKGRIVDTEAALLEQTRQAAKATDRYVHENPWLAIGIAACAGAVVGALAARRY